MYSGVPMNVPSSVCSVRSVSGVAVAFAGLFLAQAMAALPSHNYAMPVNAFVLVLLGVIVEFFARMALLVRRAF